MKSIETKRIIIISAVITVIGIGTAIVVFSSGGASKVETPELKNILDSIGTEEVESTIPETKPSTEGWRSYENKAYNFSLSYPQELSVFEYKESGGAISVVFEERVEGKGFQIYVTPYGESTVSPERFRLDVPSGVREEPMDIVVDGVLGTIFFSENGIMGETREVWFIKDGYLYEVMTYKQLDSWLSQIMQTWIFL